MTAALRAAPFAPAQGWATMRGMNDGWDAELALRFERRGARTVLAANTHAGPLVVQKALYPEGDAVCQAVILHPPGGIAGGDRLTIAVDAGEAAQVQLTTPGATKWYKSNGREAAQSVSLEVAADALVEWLPLETIVYDGAVATSSLAVDLRGSARAAGWDIVTFGRAASGERYAQGRFRQSIELRRDGALLWAEYGEARGADPVFASPAGYAGRSVSGLLWVCANEAATEATLEACREAEPSVEHMASSSLLCGVTSLPRGVLLARCLGDSTEAVRRHLAAVWSALRPAFAGRAAVAPRLWAT